MKTTKAKAVEITPAKRIRTEVSFKSESDKKKFLKNLTEIKKQLKIK
jgi:hypothetical protein